MPHGGPEAVASGFNPFGATAPLRAVAGNESSRRVRRSSLRFAELKRDLFSSKMGFEPFLPTLARLRKGGLRNKLSPREPRASPLLPGARGTACPQDTGGAVILGGAVAGRSCDAVSPQPASEERHHSERKGAVTQIDTSAEGILRESFEATGGPTLRRAGPPPPVAASPRVDPANGENLRPPEPQPSVCHALQFFIE
jgi:hypothetical protein